METIGKTIDQVLVTGLLGHVSQVGAAGHQGSQADEQQEFFMMTIPRNQIRREDIAQYLNDGFFYSASIAR